MTCTQCQHAGRRVIYLGLPMNLCSDVRCSCLWGFWSDVAMWLPVASYDAHDEPMWAFMPYDDWYPQALWRWLTKDWWE